MSNVGWKPRDAAVTSWRHSAQAQVIYCGRWDSQVAGLRIPGETMPIKNFIFHAKTLCICLLIHASNRYRLQREFVPPRFKLMFFPLFIDQIAPFPMSLLVHGVAVLNFFFFLEILRRCGPRAPGNMIPCNHMVDKSISESMYLMTCNVRLSEHTVLPQIRSLLKFVIHSKFEDFHLI
jgi:hypothetical protein